MNYGNFLPERVKGVNLWGGHADVWPAVDPGDEDPWDHEITDTGLWVCVHAVIPRINPWHQCTCSRGGVF
eukprot:1317179-Amorphochlora_amoeboformis.AAC.1